MVERPGHSDVATVSISTQDGGAMTAVTEPSGTGARGVWRHAARLIGAAEALRGEAGVRRDMYLAKSWEEAVADAH